MNNPAQEHSDYGLFFAPEGCDPVQISVCVCVRNGLFYSSTEICIIKSKPSAFVCSQFPLLWLHAEASVSVYLLSNKFDGTMQTAASQPQLLLLIWFFVVVAYLGYQIQIGQSAYTFSLCIEEGIWAHAAFETLP